MKKIKLVIAAFILVFATGAFAAESNRTIEVEAGPIITYDYDPIDLKDANGNPVETFIYNGTTYVPIRAISESFNKIVEYDADTNSVGIYTKKYDYPAMDFVVYYIYNSIYHLTERISNEVFFNYNTYLDYYFNYDNQSYNIENDIKYVNAIEENMEDMYLGLKSEMDKYSDSSYYIEISLDKAYNAMELLDKQYKSYRRLCDCLEKCSMGETYTLSILDNVVEYMNSNYDYNEQIIDICVEILVDYEEMLSHGIIEY